MIEEIICAGQVLSSMDGTMDAQWTYIIVDVSGDVRGD
jgi:hypothetical protein